VREVKEIFVGFILEYMSYTFEFWMSCEAFESGADVSIDEWDSADDGFDAVGLVGEREEEVGFLDDLSGLDDFSGDADFEVTDSSSGISWSFANR
jgi:hypothetical protein